MSVQTLDRILLQRLVDGELSHDERARLLQSMEAYPEQWREVALALIEDRVMQRDIATLIDLPGITQTVPKLEPVKLANIDSSVAGSANFPGSRPYRRGFPLLGIAASFVLMITGFTIGSRLNTPTATSTPNGVAQPSMNDVAGVPETMRLVSPNQNQELPVVEVTNLPQLPSNLLTAEERRKFRALQRKLEQEGYTVKYEPGYLEGEMPDGRKLMVPIQNINVQPNGQ